MRIKPFVRTLLLACVSQAASAQTVDPFYSGSGCRACWWVYSSRKLTSMVAITGTGLPSFMPGLKRHFSTASMAF